LSVRSLRQIGLPSVHVSRPRDLRQNAIAGFVVGVIAIPLSIALAVAVGAAPITGLYTAIFAGAVAALFGGSSFNITGPTAALVPVLAHATLAHGPEALPLLALMSGVLILVMGRLGAGRLVRLIPGTVIIGFTAGIALAIAFGQLNAFFAIAGTDPGLEHFHEKVIDSARQASTIRFAAPAIGALAVAILLVWARVPALARVPGALTAVVVTTAITWGLGVDVPTIGSKYGALPRSIPAPDFGFLDAGLAFDLLPLAISVAILAAIESLLSAVVADGMAGGAAAHEPTQELRGQGLGNLAAASFGGIPATAAIARTAAGIRNGATNRLTGVFHSLTVLAAVLLLGDLASHVPLSTLAAILIVVAWNIADAPEVNRLVRRAPRPEAAILVLTMLITLFLDITYAVGFGVLASAVLLIRQLMRIPAAYELLPDETGRVRPVSPELADMIKSRPDIAFFTAGETLSFHSAAEFEFVLSGRAHQPLILRMREVRHIDTTGMLRLEGIIEHRHRNGGRIVLTAVQPPVLRALQRFGVVDLLGRENIFEHTRDAIASIPAPGAPGDETLAGQPGTGEPAGAATLSATP